MALARVVDVVQAEIRYDHVEAGIRKGHFLGWRTHQRAPISDAFQFQVAQGGGLGISAHILVRPDIDSCYSPTAMQPGQGFRRSCKQQAAATANIQHLLVASPRYPRQHFVAVMELPNFYIKDKEQPFDSKKETG